MRDANSGVCQAGTVDGPLERGVGPGLGKRHQTVFRASRLDPAPEQPIELTLQGDAAPFSTAPTLPENSETAFLEQDILDPKSKNFDAPKPGEAFQGDDDPLDPPRRPVEANQLVPGQPPSVDRRPGG
jgi:hypothetical protein